MNRDMEFEITRDMTEGQHFHSELEVLFVIEGEVSVHMKETVFHLKNEDVIVFNSGILHEVKNDHQAIVCTVKYDYALIAEILKNQNSIFVCNSLIDNERDYGKVRDVFHRLIYQYIRQSDRNICLPRSLMYLLLDSLIEDFRMPDAAEAMKEAEDDVRLQQILQYVSGHFRTGISLKELADSLFVSASTLSRFFKRQTGIYFADYVNQMKCRYAAHDLVFTKNNITKVAVDAGFSNPSVFNKVFREIYEMTPGEYRGLWQKEQKKESGDQKLAEKLRLELREREPELNPSLRRGNEIAVSADAGQAVPCQKFWNRVINMGSVYSLTLANVQYHTVYLAEHLGISHVRLWSVFSQKLMITDGIHIGNYNYDILDSVLDFLVTHHIHPFFDFGRRPDAVLKSENQPVFYGVECVEFQTQRAWEAMFEDFVRHVVKRYGREEVNQWIFEISFDLMHESSSRYYEGENYSAADVFLHAYRTVKSYCPKALVGGPGAIIDCRPDFMLEFGRQVKKRGTVPDFVSFLLFPYHSQLENDRFVNYRVTKESYEPDSVKDMHSLMEKAGLGECPLYVTEWNLTLSNRNYLNDSCFRGAYVVKKISELWGQTDLLGIWTGSDWLSSYYDTNSIANGGNGLLTKDSIRKPAYFALRFLNDLGEELIEKGDHYIITKKGQNYSILCYNFKWYSVRYFMNEEGMDAPDRMEDIFENRDPVELKVTLQNMPENMRYVIKSRTVNEECGSLLNEWQKFQYDHRLTSQDVKYIRQSCFPRMRMERQTVKQGKLTVQKTLLPHEITIIHINEDDL